MSSAETFAIRDLRQRLSDLFVRNPAIYWADFLISVSLGYTFATLYLLSPLFAWYQFLFLGGAVIFLYRTSLFMHEIAHFRKGEMTSFSVAWNLLAGIPMLTPSFFYETHLEHHNTRHYGTEDDGEYLPLASGTWKGILGFLIQPFYLPLLTACRFLLMTPISFLHPKLRRWTLEHWSSFVIDLKYKRPIRKQDPVKLWALIDIACHLRIVVMLGASFIPGVPWYRIIMIYVIAVCILTLNHWRTLAAHRYRGDGNAMSHEDQLFDSTNITGDPIVTEIFCPVGLRYHALHHLFPGMPYHSLPAAHRRLSQQLPADSPYHRCVYPNMRTVMRELFAEVGQNRRGTRVAAQSTTGHADGDATSSDKESSRPTESTSV